MPSLPRGETSPSNTSAAVDRQFNLSMKRKRVKWKSCV